jgi:glycosyltransferase involved in cell wall biosynthesis
VTGYLVPGRDAGAFASLSRRLLADPGRAGAMGLAGRALVEDQFSLASMVRATEQLYLDVVGRSAS